MKNDSKILNKYFFNFKKKNLNLKLFFIISYIIVYFNINH